MGATTLVIIVSILYFGLQAYVHNKEKMKIVFGMFILIFGMFNLTLVSERYAFININRIDLSNSFISEIFDDLLQLSSDAEEMVSFSLFCFSLIIIWKYRLKIKLLIDKMISKI